MYPGGGRQPTTSSAASAPVTSSPDRDDQADDGTYAYSLADNYFASDSSLSMAHRAFCSAAVFLSSTLMTAVSRSLDLGFASKK